MSDTKIITVPSGSIVIVDAEDFDWLSEYRWTAYEKDPNSYVKRTYRIEGKRFYQSMHRDIFERHKIDFKGYLIDHIDGNRFNNVKSNLRVVTNAQNSRNRGLSKRSTTGYKNVTFNKREQKYKVSLEINLNGVRKCISGGYYRDLKEAVIKANELMLLHHGEFSRLNVIPE